MFWMPLVALGLSNVAFAQNTTTSGAPEPTPPVNNLEFPAQLGDYQFYGCVGSSNGFRTFVLRDSGDDVSLTSCAATCGPRDSRFFGVYDGDCYCGEELSTSTNTRVANSRCDQACAGDDEQACGGLANESRKLVRRQSVPLAILLTIYIRVSGDDGGDDGGETTLTETITSTVTDAGTTSVTTVTTTFCPGATDTPCNGNCPLPCNGPQCYCNSDLCFPVKPCTGEYCLPQNPCQGPGCPVPQPPPCPGNCPHPPPPCVGPDCPAPPPCVGPQCPPAPPAPVCPGPQCPPKPTGGPIPLPVPQPTGKPAPPSPPAPPAPVCPGPQCPPQPAPPAPPAPVCPGPECPTGTGGMPMPTKSNVVVAAAGKNLPAFALGAAAGLAFLL